jgi:hypothetical protein
MAKNMNTNEFKHWLEGFIEGRDNLSETELEIVREKLSQVVMVSSISTLPYLPQQLPNHFHPYYENPCNSTANSGSFTPTSIFKHGVEPLMEDIKNLKL